jgi:predicted aspartyl protease
MSRRLTTLLTLVSIAWLTGTTPAAAGDTQAIRFSLDGHGAVIIPVLVNGSGPFRFLLDTGSNGSAVSDALATRIAVPIVAKAEVVTASGRNTGLIGRIDHLTVGTVESSAVTVGILPAATLAQAAPGLDGVLGQDVLGSHTFTLDYRHRTLTWGAEPEESHAVRLPLVAREGRVLVELAQLGDRVVRLVPDSGTEGLVLFTRNGDVPLTLDSLPGRQTLSTLSGSADVTPVVVRHLKIGRLMLLDQPAVTVTRNEADAPEGDGLLPLHHFSSVTFNASGYIVFRR